LNRIDNAYADKVSVERAAPFKTMEQRMLKYKAECEARYKSDLENEIRRLKEFEVSRIRMEEASRYRDKMDSFRQEMETMHLEKVKELKAREESAMDRIRNKERDIEKAAFTHRQKVLKDEELMRFRENDVKNTVAMELVVVKGEKERMSQTIHDYELKIADLDQFKLRLEK
jgi:oral-facial-digital syndrome 1 protein